MSTDETNAYLQAKLQQAQGQPPNEQPKKVQLSKAKGNKAQTQPEEQPQVSVDMQVFRQMVEDVLRAELQTIRIEQPQPLDMQTFQRVVQVAIHTELQPLQTAITLLANAVQALVTEDEEEEQDDLLPTSASAHTTDEETEREFPDQQDEYEDKDDEGEGEGGEREDDDARNTLPRPPEPPTHKLKRTGPESIILGGVYPAAGVRRWEPQL